MYCYAVERFVNVIATSGKGVQSSVSTIMPVREISSESNPWRPARAIGLATLLLAGAGSLVLWWQERHPADPYTAAVEPLVEAVGKRRLFEPRLTGGFQYGALLKPQRAEGAVPSTTSWEVFAAAARVKESALNSRTAHGSAALGIAHLLVRNGDEAVRLIKAAQAEQPSVASVRSDLSAAHLVRADLAGHMLDRAWALEWAGRALEVDPTLPEALFNKALALQGLSLNHGARLAWRAFLDVESDVGWRQEAFRSLSALEAAGPRPDQVALSDEVLASRDQSALLKAVKADFALARYETETRYLPNLNRYAIEAANIGEALASLGDGDVREILSRADRASCGSFLARANSAYRVGDWAALSVAISTTSFQAGPCAEWRAYYSHLSRYIRRVGQSTELAPLVMRAEARGYLTLVARSSALLGLALENEGQFEGARAALERSQAAYRRLGDSEHEGYLGTLLAELLVVEGDVQGSWDARGDALRFSDRQRDPSQRFSVFYEAAIAALASDLPFVARAALSEVEELASGDSLRGSASPLYWSIGMARTRDAIEPGTGREELDQARTALQRIQDAASKSRNEIEFRIAEAELMALDAAEPLEARRALLGDAIASLESRGAQDRLPKLLSLRGEVVEQFGNVGEAAGAFAEAVRATEVVEAPPLGRAAYREAVLPAFEGLLRTCDCTDQQRFDVAARFLDFGLAAPSRVSADAAKLNEGEGVLAIVVGKRDLWLWTLTSKGVHGARVLRPPNLRATVQSALAGLAADDLEGVRTSAAELYRRLFAPVAGHLGGVKRLVFVTHGPWLNVPFQALFDPVSDTFLGETLASSQASSLSAALERRARSPLNLAAIVADPSNGLPRLKGAVAEAGGIGSLYPRTVVLVGKDATEGAVREAVTGADVVHLAIHADFRITQPGQMALLLTDRVPLATVAKWRLARSPVVVLAACDSARSADERGGEGMNLVAPFLEAGASAVIGSLRPLDDGDVAALFVSLHKELREAVTPADAVHSILASRKRNRSLAALSLSLYQSIG
jgi:tetratricopeptide (TPR) repeat protein